MIAALAAHVLGMQADIEQLKTLFGNALKIGPVGRSRRFTAVHKIGATL